MRRKLKTALWPVLCAMPLAACGAQRLLPEMFAVRLEVPPSLLTCAPPPVPRPVETQKDVALLIVDLAEAGADCRGKLAAVRQVLAPDGEE